MIPDPPRSDPLPAEPAPAGAAATDAVVRLPRGARVCIVLLTGVGDVVHGMPIAVALKRHDPTAHVTWVVEPPAAGLLAPHPAVDDVAVFHRAHGLRGLRRLARDMRGRRFDIALNFNVYSKSVFPVLLSRAPLRLGIDRRRTREGVWLASNRHLPPRPHGNTQDLFLEFAPALGLAAEPVEWRLEPTPTERERAAALRAGTGGRPLAAVVPASKIPTKDWAVEQWVPVVDALERDFGYRVALVGGPGAREVEAARRITEAAASPPIWGLADGIREVLWRLSAADLVLAPDTGPLHMAHAMDVPVIGIYGYTNPARVGPWRRYRDLVADGFHLRGEAHDAVVAETRPGGMERVSVDMVVERVARATERYVRPRS